MLGLGLFSRSHKLSTNFLFPTEYFVDGQKEMNSFDFDRNLFGSLPFGPIRSLGPRFAAGPPLIVPLADQSLVFASALVFNGTVTVVRIDPA